METARIVIICLALGACTCAHRSLDQAREPEYVYVAQEQRRQPGDIHYVPAIPLTGAIDEKSVDALLAQLQEVQDAKPEAILLEIDSQGGEIEAGFRVIKAIEASRVPVHCFVDGRGQSMAFAILQTCTSRGATRRSNLMVHEPWVLVNRNSMTQYQLDDMAESLRMSSHLLVEHEAHRMGMTPEVLKERIRGREWWMTAPEALEARALDYMAWDTKAVRVRLRASLEVPVNRPDSGPGPGPGQP